MWSDNESEIDLLRFSYMAESIKAIVRDNSLTPTTIGLFGDWGSGKSTLLKMVHKDLALYGEKIKCISFNGWLFEGYEDARMALMGSILDSLNEDKNLVAKAGDLIKKLLGRINWLRASIVTGKYVLPTLLGQPHLTAALAGKDALDTAKKVVEETGKKVGWASTDKIESLVKEPPSEELRKGIREFRKDFEQLLEQTGLENLVVFIDDLDRCLPDTIIETLEAIRLFLFVPKTTFIIGADERLVEYAVRKRFPELPGTKLEVGRDYLEKMVQIPIRIPPLSGTDVHSYMNLLFMQKHIGKPEDIEKVCKHLSDCTSSVLGELSFTIETSGKLGLKPEGNLQEDLDFIAQIAAILSPGLGGSPRRTKRFLNALILRLKMGELRGLNLKRQILAKLMLLEYLKPEFFKDLARLQSLQEGKPKELTLIEQTAKKPSESETEKKSELQPDYQTWLADSWMKQWLVLEPALGNIDLRPYFYIAHDKIGSLNYAVHLSPRAQEILNQLLSSSTVTQKLGLKECKTLNLPDATAVFTSLSERIRQAEELDKTSPQQVFFDFIQERTDFLPQAVSLYSSLPETKIKLETVPALALIAKENASTQELISQLIERWSKSKTNEILARAAEQHLKGKKK